MKHKLLLLSACLAAAVAMTAQDVIIKLTKGELARIAVPDLRGAGEAQPLMGVFNQTLWDDLEGSGLFRMAPKSLYPLQVPQRPEEIRRPPAAARGATTLPSAQGLALADWSNPPVSANYLAIGYTGVQAGQIVLLGWLYNPSQADPAGAQIFGKTYLGPLHENGARKVAHEFAADILKQFGGASLAGTKIYFVSERTRGVKEIWSMDPDGSNQKPLTQYNSISTTPAVSHDGTKVAFTSYLRGNPAIFVHSSETGRRLPFYNPVSSMVGTPTFTPDGRQMVISASVEGWPQLHIANADGSGLRRLSFVRAIEVEPKVNPKTGADMVFVSGRAGPQQIYRMNMDGADVRLLTTGEGQASNPCWHPDGQHIAFAWTRGYEPGNFNIFVMDVATRRFDQLTTGAGRNENPNWAPDGRHLVFSSNRNGSLQIYTMLADGTQVSKQLTTQGRNTMPVWGKAIQ
ncbi:MAG: translocation protein TolB [Acidobacteriota bacterium]